MLVVICFYGLATAMAFQSIPPILSLIIEDLGISHAEAGLVMSIFTIPGILLTIPAGLFSNRFGMKQLGIITSIIVIAGSALVIFSTNFFMLLAGRILIGIGGVTIPIVGMQGVARLFIGKRLGLAMGIYGATMSLGTVIPQISFGAAGLLWGWRSAILIIIIMCAITLAAFVFLFKIPEDKATGPGNPNSVFSIFKMGRNIWLLAATWGLFGTANVSLMTFLPDFMYQSNIDLRVAGLFTSAVMIVGVIMSPVSGHLLDKSKYKSLFIIISGVITAALICALPANVPIVLLFTILIGVFTTAIGPAVFALTPALVSGTMIALAYGIVFTTNNIGMFIGPSIAGWFRDISGTYTLSFWFIGALYFVMSMLAFTMLAWEIRKHRSAGN
jgi:MFS family permease